MGGSQARREQSSHSDQDNALLIADQAKPEDDAYFAALAKFVNDGLDACGFVYCPGDVMASNPKWRQPLRIWHKYFANWIMKPEPMALMLSSVFFDLRPLHDPDDLFTDLQERMLERYPVQSDLHRLLTANALKNRPPLGFFRNIVLIHGGDHDHTFDIKHRGTVPIIDLARIYALSAGIPETNTIERLQAAADRGRTEQGRRGQPDRCHRVHRHPAHAPSGAPTAQWAPRRTTSCRRMTCHRSSAAISRRPSC